MILPNLFRLLPLFVTERDTEFILDLEKSLDTSYFYSDNFLFETDSYIIIIDTILSKSDISFLMHSPLSTFEVNDNYLCKS